MLDHLLDRGDVDGLGHDASPAVRVIDRSPPSLVRQRVDNCRQSRSGELQWVLGGEKLILNRADQIRKAMADNRQGLALALDHDLVLGDYEALVRRTQGRRPARRWRARNQVVDLVEVFRARNCGREDARVERDAVASLVADALPTACARTRGFRTWASVDGR